MNNISLKILYLLGVSEGDFQAVKNMRSVFHYVFFASLRSFLRLFANHCIIPSLRVALFRISGIRIGKRVQVNLNVNFMDDFRSGMIALEDNVSIAPFVSLIASSHPNNSILLHDHERCAMGPIRIKSGAWLGVGAVVLPGLTVGKCSIIGSNAVVTKEVLDYSIMAGVPAKKIGDVRDTHRILKSKLSII